MVEITSSLLKKYKAFKYLNNSIIKVSEHDHKEKFRQRLIEYVNDTADNNDDRFFWNHLEFTRFLNPYEDPDIKNSVAFTKEDMIVRLNAPGIMTENIREWDFIYCHECLHLLWETFGVEQKIIDEQGKCDHMLMNIVSDCIINDYLSFCRGKTAPKDLITPEYIEKQFGVKYDRQVDTQYTLYLKCLKVAEQMKKDKKIQQGLNNSGHNDQQQGQQGQKGQKGQQSQSGQSGQSGKSGQQGDQSQQGQQGQSGQSDKSEKSNQQGQQGQSGGNSNESAKDAADRAQKAADKAQESANKAKDTGDKKTAENAQGAADKAKEAAKEAKDAASKAEAAGKNGDKKEKDKQTKKAQDAADKAEAEANKAEQSGKDNKGEGKQGDQQNGEKSDGSSSKGDTSDQPGTQNTGDVDKEEQANMSDIIERAKNNVTKYKNRISGDFGDFVRKCKSSFKMEPKGLGVNVDTKSASWDVDMSKTIHGHVKSAIAKHKRMYKKTYSKMKRGIGFINYGDPIQPGKKRKKNTLIINVAFYVDRSGSMMSENRIEHVFNACYTIAESLTKMFGRDSVVEKTKYKMFVFNRQITELEFGKTINATGGTIEFDKILKYISEETNEYMVNIVITDGEMDITESEVKKFAKEVKGMIMFVANKAMPNIEAIAKDLPGKLYFIQADPQFKLDKA